ncbi:RHS repeat-associated core domain-containing protein [Ligaoa zhengdingensis]|uniref:RHS repeat-associated core domain-containing protein n=1 Tax=Ligaoa zhengdingensis TaxID=2763658 RepID=UPI003CCEB375
MVQLTDAAGTVTQEYEYDAFGNEQNPSANDTNPLRYCGEYFDAETGTIYLQAQYYDPRIGRFTASDPARSGLNWYTYCNNNPIIFIDPMGLEALRVLGSGVFGGIKVPGYEDHYGGTQNWFGQQWQVNSGCGTVAAANMLAYMALNDDQFSALYTYPDLTYDSYKSYQNDIIRYVTPLSITRLEDEHGNIIDGFGGMGIWFPSALASGAKSYAISKGATLKSHIRNNVMTSFHSATNFIRNALSNDRPVGMVTLLNPSLKFDDGKSYDRHWVTITSINQSKGHDEYDTLTVSSWNTDYTIDWNTTFWLNTPYVGLIYFD